MPPEELQLIEDFLTFIENARTTRPGNDPLWENLQEFETNLVSVEDRPVKLALYIQSWCQEFGVKIDAQVMRQLRDSMVKKGKVIPKPLEGEQPSKVYNKAMISETVHQARPENQA
jgi:hypothetical protein